MIQIKEVTSKKMLREFVKYPNRLYKDNKYFVPDLLSDDLKTLSKDSNPAFEFCEASYFLAYKENEIVGRIGALINHKSNEKWNEKNVRFTHFDFIDDLEVSKALLDTVEKWASDRKYESVMGPLGLTDMDHQGLLVEGFDELDMFITLYNYPYYKDHLISNGYEKEVDWVEYQIKMPTEPNKLIERIAERAAKRQNVRLLNFRNKKHILPWAKQIFTLYNEAFAPLFGTTELTQAQIDYYINAFFGFVNPDFIKVVVNEHDEVVAFAITMPSLSKAMQKAKGKLFPFGFIPLLKAIKGNEILDLYLIAVRPDLQGKGINTIMMDSLLKTALKYKIKYAETGPELETNSDIQNLWKHFDTRQHRRRRIFKKELNGG